MFEIQNYASFIAAIVVFQLIPGPGTLAILNATARSGVGAGLGAVGGTLLGDLVYMIAALAGLAALMNAHPALFQGLQWFGAAYLGWMGVQLLRPPVAGADVERAPRQSGWRYFRQAFAVSLTNPKVMLFFVAFFPLFLHADAAPLTLGAMVAHVTLLSLLYQAGLVLIGNRVARKLSVLPGARRLATRLAGVALLAFGIKLALNNR
ncbi:LysE family translocator [Candidatus Accumulibacter sp. ACC007]|uniref:LysE family translocator n=1 Tax=Candidatus Accumulibacter sp. ACC007 TaxID=2823333 RepID=UPI0025C035E6|nr:LysE family translocator [Candidatus Accumulibacter sp. ACC007]